MSLETEVNVKYRALFNKAKTEQQSIDIGKHWIIAALDYAKRRNWTSKNKNLLLGDMERKIAKSIANLKRYGTMTPTDEQRLAFIRKGHKKRELAGLMFKIAIGFTALGVGMKILGR